MADTPATPNGTTPIRPKDPNVGGGSFGAVPQMLYAMTFKEVGATGLRAFGGYVREEFLPNLQGRQAAVVYREMADNSPVIGGMLFAINSVMRKAGWRTVPANDSPEAQEAADFADSLRLDMSMTWEESVAESLSMLPFGYAPMEICYKRRLGRNPGMADGKPLPKSKFDDGKIGWSKLPIRGQDTVIKWFFDENGEVLGLTQQPYVGPLIDIPMEKLLLFRPSQHKGNPEGRSVIRNAYRPYYMVKRMEEQEAILAERMNGIPVVRVPSTLVERAATGEPGATALLEQFKSIARSVRVDEQMGIVMPSDPWPTDNGVSAALQYTFELIAPGGGKGTSSTGSNDIIQRQNSLMMMSVLADFLTLGHNSSGTQALSNSKQDMFFQATEGYLNSNAATFNRDGLERVWELNGMDYDLMPEYQPDLAQRIDLDVLSNFIQRLAQSGMAIFPNTEIEQALLDAAGLPDIGDTSAADLLYDDRGQPVSIVGPHAAAATQELAPPPPPEPNSPQDKLQKAIMGSVARRLRKQAGPRFGVNTKKLPTLPLFDR